MEHSAEISEIAAALAKAQGQIEGAAKSSSNPHFKSKYADLSEVWAACREALTTNGISVVQSPQYGAHRTEQDSRFMGVSVTTMLLHSSGQWMRSTLSVPTEKTNAHCIGSAITYARRYALSAMVGIAPEDDDGNAAVDGAGKNLANGGTHPVVSQEPVKPLAEPMRHIIQGQLKAKGKSLEEIAPHDLEAAYNNPAVRRRMTPADVANIEAVLQRLREIDASMEGSSLEEDEIPASYSE